jgi:REP element-mobilizing transposase RayT
MRSKQLELFKQSNWTQGFGGSLLKKLHAKTARPFKKNNPIHLVLRSTKARGKNSFLSHTRWIDSQIKNISKACGVKIERYENVGNHLHILLRSTRRESVRAFLRGITSTIARKFTGARRGVEKKLKFWDALPFSRLIKGHSAYKVVQEYFNKNRIEAIGFEDFVDEQFELARLADRRAFQ